MALVTQFLTTIRAFVLDHNGDQLRDYLQVEQSSSAIYFTLGQELRTGFAPNSNALEKLVDNCLPEEEEVPEGKGSPWAGFNAFIKEYLEYWRDIRFDNIPVYHELLSNLVTYVPFCTLVSGALILSCSPVNAPQIVFQRSRQPVLWYHDVEHEHLAQCIIVQTRRDA